VGALPGGVVDLLEHPRYREHESRLELLQRRYQVLHVGGVAQPAAGVHRGVLDQPGERVGQRQEQQRGGTLVEQLGDRGARVGGVEVEVAMGQHATLRAAGGAGGVDEGREVVGAGGVPGLLDPGRVDRLAGLDQPLQGAVLDLPYVVDAGHERGVRGGLHHAGHRAGVGEDPLDLLGAGRLVDRYGDAAGRPDGEVDQRPLVPGPAHQGHPVAGLDPGRDQPLRQRRHLGTEAGARDVLPAVPGTAGELDGVRCLGRAVPDQIRQVGRVPDGDQGRYGELLHACLLSSCYAKTYPALRKASVSGRGVVQPGGVRGSLPSMAETSTQSIVIAAPRARIAEVICDFPRYPQWVSAAKRVEVVEEYEDGYASQVRFVLDAGVIQDEYTLAYEYAEDISRIEWHLVEPSRIQKKQQGSYDIEENDDGTSTVTYTLAVELSIGMLGMFKRKAEKMIMDTALRELKRRVEG
jgi:hypothetical protein